MNHRRVEYAATPVAVRDDLSADGYPPDEVAGFQRAWHNCHGVAISADQARAKLAGFRRMGFTARGVNCG